jgi:hypothetical protein
MINLLEGYDKFLTIIDEVPYFETEKYAKFKGSDEEFYSEFSQTQIFMLFLQNENDEFNSYFNTLKNKIGKENIKNVFSKEYFEIKNLNSNLINKKRRSNSNELKFLKSLNSMYINEINNEKKFELDFQNTNINKITIKSFNFNFSEIKIIDDYENIYEGDEKYILYPYFFDLDSKFKINENMKSEILLNPDSIQKCILSLYDKDQEFENILPINERIFENLKILDFEKIGENCFRYSLVDDVYLNNNNSNININNNKNDDFNLLNNNRNYNKQCYNLKNIIMDIFKKKEADLILNHLEDDNEKLKLKRQLTKRVTLNL